jgi:hypothetical protein
MLMDPTDTRQEEHPMANEELLIQSALSVWKLNAARTVRIFHPLNEDELQKEVAPGRNRLIYVWGHLTAVNDALFPLLGLGAKLHPALDEMFLSNPDSRSRSTYSGAQLAEASGQIHQALWAGFSNWTPQEWLAPHNGVPTESAAHNPLRNRFTVVVNRTAHMAYHLGQAVLAIPRG